MEQNERYYAFSVYSLCLSVPISFLVIRRTDSKSSGRVVYRITEQKTCRQSRRVWLQIAISLPSLSYGRDVDSKIRFMAMVHPVHRF